MEYIRKRKVKKRNMNIKKEDFIEEVTELIIELTDKHLEPYEHIVTVKQRKDFIQTTIGHIDYDGEKRLTYLELYQLYDGWIGEGIGRLTPLNLK